MVAHFTLRSHGVKAFGYNERVVKSDFFSEKDLVFIIRAQHKMSNHLIKAQWYRGTQLEKIN